STDAVQAACQTAMQIAKAQKAAIFLSDQENKLQVRLTYEVGLTAEHRRMYDGPIHRPDIFNVEPRIVPDVAMLDERDALAELAAAGHFKALAEIPLKSGNALIGVQTV